MTRNSRLSAGTLAEALLLSAVFASSFTSLLDWSGWATEIQRTEIILILLLPVALLVCGQRLWSARRWALVLGAYVAANLAAGLAAGTSGPIVESLGRGYLVALCGLVACYVTVHKGQGVRRLSLAWISGGVLLAVVSLAGYAYALAGYENSTVQIFTNYPYFGTVMRAAGFTVTPGMLAIVLGLSILGTWTLGGSGRFRLVACALLAGAPYTSGRVLANIGNIRLVETSDLALKRVNLALGLQHPIFGVGPGHSNAYLGHMKAEGLYPRGLPQYDPHSTWIGAFSENRVPRPAHTRRDGRVLGGRHFDAAAALVT